LIILTIEQVGAVPITSQADLNPLDTVIDFEGLPVGFTSTNPLTLSDATFSSESTLHVWNDPSYPALTDYPTFI